MNYREPRIYKVTYRSAIKRRIAVTLMKVPYGGLYGMTEVMTRMVATGQVRWFRVDIATTQEIDEWGRTSLERWLPALMRTNELGTGVDWTA